MKNKAVTVLFLILLLVMAFSVGRISSRPAEAANVTAQDAITQLSQRVATLESKVAQIEARHKEEDKPRREPRDRDR